MTYQHKLSPISQADAEQQPEADRLFPAPTPGGFPRITLRTTVVYEGFTFDVTFNDTPIATAAAMLKERGCAPAASAAPALATTGAPAAEKAGPPICPIHGKPMKAMQHADKQGRTHWCTQKVGDSGYCQERA